MGVAEPENIQQENGKRMLEQNEGIARKRINRILKGTFKNSIHFFVGSNSLKQNCFFTLMFNEGKNNPQIETGATS
jgi:hypothetical protein